MIMADVLLTMRSILVVLGVGLEVDVF